MYTFKKETDLKAYDDFIETHGGQYIQCSRWEKVKTTWKCAYYSGFENGERVLAVLVMERDLPAAGKIWYAPAGPVCNLENTRLLSEFTEFIKGEVAKNKVTAFIMDPPVSLRVNGERTEEGHAMHKTLLSLGYTLNPSIENYTYKQPVQLFIPLKDENGNALYYIAAMWFHYSNNCTIQNCERAGQKCVTDGMTVDFDHWSFNCTYQYIYSHDNTSFMVNNSKDDNPNRGNTVRYCLSVNDGGRSRFSTNAGEYNFYNGCST